MSAAMTGAPGNGVGLSSSDSARPGELVRGSRHFSAAREAPRDFGLLSGNVTGAHALLLTALELRDRVLGLQPVKREMGSYVPTDREAMAEMVTVTQQEIMKALVEISDYITNSK